MSHTTTVKALIKDKQAIKAAARELGLDLQTNVSPRLYYNHQHPEKSDFVLKLKGRYDVGLDKQSDGTYALAFDAHGGDVFNQCGNNKVMGPSRAVAKFVQTYAKHAAINAATAKGYMVSGTTVDKEGNVNILVNVPS